MPFAPSAPNTVRRSQRPAGVMPGARWPCGARPYRQAMLAGAQTFGFAGTPHSSRNTSRSGATPPTPAPVSVRQAARARATSPRSCSAARRVRFLPAPSHARRRPMRGGQVDRHLGLFGQAVPAPRQEGVGPLQHPPQRRLRLPRDHRLAAAAHPASLAPPALPQNANPVLRRRATHREPPGHRRHSLARLHRCQNPPPQVRRIRPSRPRHPKARHMGTHRRTYTQNAPAASIRSERQLMRSSTATCCSACWLGCRRTRRHGTPAPSARTATGCWRGMPRRNHLGMTPAKVASQPTLRPGPSYVPSGPGSI